MKHVNHITHLEDLLIDQGSAGVSAAVTLIESVVKTLQGNTVGHLNLSVKWDGAPSIFAGRDPATGKFFVAKKSIFNKNPKVYYTEEELEEDIDDPHLLKKLKLGLKYFPKLGIKGVLQGDFLFSKEDIHEMEVNGKPYITFHPNTIVYAIPKESELASQLLASELGVVWHTSYRGSSFETMSANFTGEISGYLKETKEVWSVDPSYKDLSGTVTLTEEEANAINVKVKHLIDLYLDKKKYLDVVAENKYLKRYMHKFINKRIRENGTLLKPHVLNIACEDYLLDEFHKEAFSRKSVPGQKVQMRMHAECVNDLKKTYIFWKAYGYLIEIKQMLITALTKDQAIDTFLKIDDKHHTTNHEGFVAVSHIHGIVKLVDRHQFSYANFNPEVQKGWEVYTG